MRNKNTTMVFFLVFLALFMIGYLVAEEYHDCVDQGNCTGPCWCEGTLHRDGRCSFHCTDGLGGWCYTYYECRVVDP